jgi:hypothetical protein
MRVGKSGFLSFIKWTLSHLNVTVTDGYYRSGYDHQAVITQALNVQHRRDPPT